MISYPMLRARFSALTALLAFGFSLEASAQTVATTPVGAMTYTFPATTQITTTYISIPLTNPSVYTGSVVSLTSNTITFNGTPFVLGELAQEGRPFFARIVTGLQAGRIMLVTANTINSVTVDTTDNSSQTTNLDTLGWTLALGDRVDIIVGDTLADVFGDGSVSNPLKFSGGTGLLNADQIAFYNKSSGRLVAYFYSTTLGYWRSSSNVTNRNSLILYPEDTIVILRRADRPAVDFTIVGEVPVVAPLTKVTGNASTALVSSRIPVNVNLSSLEFTNWIKSNSSLTADSLAIYNSSTGRLDGYFKRADNEWRKIGGGAVNYSSLVLPGGSSLALLKRNSVTGQSSFISFPLPYTLNP